MKKLTTILLLVGTLALGANAQAVQLFDFDAQANLPASVGGTAEVLGRIVNGGAVATPLPLDFANYEYTIVVTGLTLDSIGQTSDFSGGTVQIIQDAATAADWTDAATFTDGVVVLSGVLPAFTHTMFTGTLGSGVGLVDWTGGTLLNDLAIADQTGWPFLTGVSRAADQVEPGFTERWDGKIEPSQEVVATVQQSWSALKASFR